MSDIPDPTELRKKLGLIKPAKKPTVEAYVDSRIPQIEQEKARGTKGITLANAEAEVREIDEAESQKIDEILANCPPACAKWMKQFIILGNQSAASRAINYSAGILRYWKQTHPEFRALYEFYHEEVRLRWNELGERRAVEGFREEIFKPDGSLKYTKMRQDPHFMKELMKKIDPDWRDENAGTQINIVVERSSE